MKKINTYKKELNKAIEKLYDLQAWLNDLSRQMSQDADDLEERDHITEDQQERIDWLREQSSALDDLVNYDLEDSIDYRG